MKVAHITTVHPKNDNRIFYKECLTLKDSGYKVSLIIAGENSDNINDIEIIGFKKYKGRIKRIFKTSFIDLLEVCKKVDADIYHFHDPEIIFAGIVLKLKGKKVIYDIHENNPASILSKPYIKSKFLRVLFSKIFNIIEQIAVVFFDAIVTARPDISERFKHKRLITLRNFPILPDLNNIKNIEVKKTRPAVIFVGGMTKLRGIEYLLEAFKQLPEVELWLLGPVQDSVLKEKIENAGSNVKYFGVVEAYDVFGYIQKADIGIITFLEAPNHIKTLATKPFEYMACGKPMIMSNFKYWQDVFEDLSLYVNPANSQEIVEAIKKLLSSKEQMRFMSEKSLKLSNEKYNWEQESKKLIELYGELNK